MTMPEERLAITAFMRSANGRAASAALCARRSFAAATICMALVIFCVAFTEAMRLRRSFSEGMARPSPLPLAGRGRGWGSRGRRRRRSDLPRDPPPPPSGAPPPQGGRQRTPFSSAERLRERLARALQLARRVVGEVARGADRVEDL